MTDADGMVTSPELYLGAYMVYEAKDGFALDVAGRPRPWSTRAKK